MSKENSMSKLIRVGDNIYPASQVEGKWWTDWPDGKLRTCTPEQVFDSYLNEAGEWVIKISVQD